MNQGVFEVQLLKIVFWDTGEAHAAAGPAQVGSWRPSIQEHLLHLGLQSKSRPDWTGFQHRLKHC